MKRIILIWVIHFFINLSGLAQEIDQNTYNKLVDYVNCMYTDAYIESQTSSGSEMHNIAVYHSKFKEKIQQCSPEKPVEFEVLSKWLKENGWASTEQKLVQIINNKKKQNNNENKNTDQIISSLLDTKCLTQRFSEILSDTKARLELELRTKYKSSTQQESTNSQAANHPINVSSPDNQADKSSQTTISLTALWVVLTILGIFLILLFILLLSRTSSEHINNTSYSSKRLESKFILKSEPQLEHKSVVQYNLEVVNRILEIEKNVSNLSEVVQTLLEQQKSIIIDPIGKAQQLNYDQPNQNNVKFLKTAPSGIFNNVFENSSGCYFKLFDSNGNEAKFEFSGNIEEAIANRNAIFDETSEPFDPPKDATKIVTVVPGSVVFQNGKWKITTKARIKFE